MGLAWLGKAGVHFLKTKLTPNPLTTPTPRHIMRRKVCVALCAPQLCNSEMTKM